MVFAHIALGYGKQAQVTGQTAAPVLVLGRSVLSQQLRQQHQPTMTRGLAELVLVQELAAARCLRLTLHDLWPRQSARRCRRWTPWA